MSRGSAGGAVEGKSQSAIDAFLAGSSFAVVGASQDRKKFGNKVLRAYLAAGRRVYPVNPKLDEVEGQRCYPDLGALPEPVDGVSIVTPPAVTESIVQQAAAAGMRRLWMQPGAESQAAIERARELELELIHSGPCVMEAMRRLAGRSDA